MKDPSYYDKLQKMIDHKGDLNDRTVTVCSGLDLVNISYMRMTASDAYTAQAWVDGLQSITHNFKASNVCPMTSLMKHWMRIHFQVNPNGKIPVKSLTRTFASGKTEKIVTKSLEELQLPSNKPIKPSFYKLTTLSLQQSLPYIAVTNVFGMLSDSSLTNRQS
ncbi:1-phosphatidylinositol 4,5-bisphosphate phosphodiesterase beta-4-like [Anneissia japonica]|uniref:1-phosphatidylinositol 4,5-bisphosphate phosphodiesterase beta-4-like n=1 Tax=Anneissia japonica TaxID=1529436 RepID=UPI0014256F29|nr:1-phosphatidylinositol 4,5-bisphosphate phosphodiesterase beta-4-like [Anneissia japonica]